MRGEISKPESVVAMVDRESYTVGDGDAVCQASVALRFGRDLERFDSYEDRVEAQDIGISSHRGRPKPGVRVRTATLHMQGSETWAVKGDCPVVWVKSRAYCMGGPAVTTAAVGSGYTSPIPLSARHTSRSRLSVLCVVNA